MERLDGLVVQVYCELLQCRQTSSSGCESRGIRNQNQFGNKDALKGYFEFF